MVRTGLSLEDVMGDALGFWERPTHDVLVILVCVAELDHFGRICVQMIIVHSIILDCHFGILQVTDIASGSTSVLLQEVAETLQLVIHIVRLFKVFEEVLLS